MSNSKIIRGRRHDGQKCYLKSRFAPYITPITCTSEIIIGINMYGKQFYCQFACNVIMYLV